MARRTNLVGIPDLPFIYNVSQPVGPNQLNFPNDVELVQFLLAAFAASPQGFHRILFPAPARNGLWDLATGFWTYEAQFHLEELQHTIVDGIVSPAREGSNGTYEGIKMWIIVPLNISLKTHTPQIFDTLPDNPNLSKSLRDAIRPAESPLPATRK